MLTQAFACLAIAFGSLSLSSLVFRWSSAVDRLRRDGREGICFLLCTVSFSEICRLEDANIAVSFHPHSHRHLPHAVYPDPQAEQALQIASERHNAKTSAPASGWTQVTDVQNATETLFAGVKRTR